MSKSNKNKKLLNEMQSPKEEIENDSVEVETKTCNKLKRHFVCKCGCDVSLEGEIALDKHIQSCSKCSRE